MYLVLGDSVAFGIGASDPTRTDDVAQLAARLREATACAPGLEHAKGARHAQAACRQLQVVDLSVPGATTATLIDKQLGAAVALLEERNQNKNPRDDVQVVTVTIGGNDVFRPVLAACVPTPTPACATTIQRALASYAANIDRIVRELRAAAGPDTEIVLTAYANALPGCSLPRIGSLEPYVPLGNLVLEGGSVPNVGTLPFGLNDLTRAAATRYGAMVAEVPNLTAAQLAGDCLHPNDKGYDVYTDAFAEVLLP